MPAFFSRIGLAALLFFALPALAQTKAPAATSGGFKSSGDLSYNSTGIRLQRNAKGLARVQSPEIDVTAQTISLGLVSGKITQVTARGSVNLKLNLSPRGGGAAARIEVRCTSAVLTPSERKLVLRGNLNGFYQVAGGARNTLSGDVATLTYPSNGNLVALLEGGARGVSLTIPAETVGRADALGAVTITAERASLNQSDGSAVFSGKARAISKGGANAFDVAATSFVLTRGASGAIATLKTTGRTLVKLDLPPDPTPANATSGVGKPTHIEVAADSAVINRAASSATFEGNVKGFYRLAPASGAPQNFDFAGTRAVIGYAAAAPGGGNAAAGLSVHVTGAEVEGPALNFDF